MADHSCLEPKRSGCRGAAAGLLVGSRRPAIPAPAARDSDQDTNGAAATLLNAVDRPGMIGPNDLFKPSDKGERAKLSLYRGRGELSPSSGY